MQSISLEANRPSYKPALDALRKHEAARGTNISRQESAALKEISRRLRRLENEVGYLVNINNGLSADKAPKITFDPQTDTMTMHSGDFTQSVKLNRANSNVPIRLDAAGYLSAYEAGSSQTEVDPAKDRLRATMESLLEQYYQSAHRVLKLVQTLPGKNSFECREITIVRNKLVEHPEGGEPYTFGHSSTGPVVRPVHRPGREWIDRGLVPNTISFVEALVRAFSE